jgi:hypothetical protein
MWKTVSIQDSNVARPFIGPIKKSRELTSVVPEAYSSLKRTILMAT